MGKNISWNQFTVYFITVRLISRNFFRKIVKAFFQFQINLTIFFIFAIFREIKP